jgi:predicted amidohydrolase YtcJ
MNGWLFRDAEIDGRRADVRVRAGRIAELGRLERRGEEEIRCGGAALIPGLHDHHLHLRALAAWDLSVRCGPGAVTDQAGLAAALATAEPDSTGWIRGVGYAESVAGDLDAAALDAFRPDVPVRVQHRSGALWTLNSAAIAATHLAHGDHPGIERDGRGSPTGRVWRSDAWLRTLLPASPPNDLRTLGASLAALGLTSLTDATPDLDADSLATLSRAVTGGALPQRLHLLGAPTGFAVPGITTGPRKIVIADSDLPNLHSLAETIARVHAEERAVAVHCVSYEALAILLAAFDATGTRPGDRVEHAALVPPALIGDLRCLGVRVVTQPGFLLDRGDDYLRDLPPGHHPDLYRCASLVAAGVPLALSSDAPYGPVDPWRVMAAAVERRTPSGAVAGRAERLGPRQALAAYLTGPDGAPRTIRLGAPADLLLLDGPLDDVLAHLPGNPIRTVFIRGRKRSGPSSA